MTYRFKNPLRWRTSVRRKQMATEFLSKSESEFWSKKKMAYLTNPFRKSIALSQPYNVDASWWLWNSCQSLSEFRSKKQITYLTNPFRKSIALSHIMSTQTYFSNSSSTAIYFTMQSRVVKNSDRNKNYDSPDELVSKMHMRCCSHIMSTLADGYTILVKVLENSDRKSKWLT